jgi:hypothetical protein
MSLKNLLICFISFVFILMIILVAMRTNPATMASPEGESLNPILVSTEAINYHDFDALYEGKNASFIDDPHAIDNILRSLNQVSCKRKAVSANDELVTAATHRVRFLGGGATLYLDNKSGCFWFDYQETIPNKFLIGYKQNENGDRHALIYQVKDTKDLNDFIAALETNTLESTKIDYEYAALDSSGVRFDFLAVDLELTDLTEEEALAEAESLAGLILPLDSRKSIMFVMREKGYGFNNDLINIQALVPNQGGLRLMNNAFSIDPTEITTNIFRSDYKWNEDHEITNFALLKVIVEE